MMGLKPGEQIFKKEDVRDISVTISAGGKQSVFKDLTIAMTGGLMESNLSFFEIVGHATRMEKLRMVATVLGAFAEEGILKPGIGMCIVMEGVEGGPVGSVVQEMLNEVIDNRKEEEDEPWK